MSKTLSHGAQRVQDALRALGAENEVIEHDQTTRSAKEAAAAIGCSVAQIAKSLVFRATGGQPVLVIASGVNRVNEAGLGTLLGTALEKPDADYVQTATGFAIGGVPPLGHRAPLLTLIDEDLLALGEIWAAGGTANAVFKVTPIDLVRLTGGRVVKIK